MEKTRVVIFGAGSISKVLTEHKKKDVEIIAYLVSGDYEAINDTEIITLEQLKDVQYDYVVVAFGNTPKGIAVLQNAGVPDDKIVGYANSGMFYDENILQQKCNLLIDDELHNKNIPELFDIPKKKYYLCGMNIEENYGFITRDYVREQTMILLAKEIYRKNVRGSVVDIGVSQGVLSEKINTLFPDRTLYLFDTYDGLPQKEKEYSCALGWGEKQYALTEKGICEDILLERLPYPERCVIKKGYFPDTFDITEKIAFVSMDLDFYDSTKKGLELIYPLLSEGGYILIHDYNNIAFTATQDAVVDFCEENHVTGVPIPDVAGTIVLTKQT